MIKRGKEPFSKKGCMKYLSRGELRGNIAYIRLYWKYIRNADIKELSEIPVVTLKRFKTEIEIK